MVSYHAKGVEKLKAQQERFSFYHVHRSFSLCSSDSTSESGVIANTSHFNLI